MPTQSTSTNVNATLTTPLSSALEQAREVQREQLKADRQTRGLPTKEGRLGLRKARQKRSRVDLSSSSQDDPLLIRPPLKLRQKKLSGRQDSRESSEYRIAPEVVLAGVDLVESIAEDEGTPDTDDGAEADDEGIGSSGDETDWGVESENEREEIVWTHLPRQSEEEDLLSNSDRGWDVPPTRYRWEEGREWKLAGSDQGEASDSSLTSLSSTENDDVDAPARLQVEMEVGSDFEPGDGEDDGEYEIDLFEEGDVVGSDFLENEDGNGLRESDYEDSVSSLDPGTAPTEDDPSPSDDTPGPTIFEPSDVPRFYDFFMKLSPSKNPSTYDQEIRRRCNLIIAHMRTIDSCLFWKALIGVGLTDAELAEVDEQICLILLSGLSEAGKAILTATSHPTAEQLEALALEVDAAGVYIILSISEGVGSDLFYVGSSSQCPTESQSVRSVWGMGARRNEHEREINNPDGASTTMYNTSRDNPDRKRVYCSIYALPMDPEIETARTINHKRAASVLVEGILHFWLNSYKEKSHLKASLVSPFLGAQHLVGVNSPDPLGTKQRFVGGRSYVWSKEVLRAHHKAIRRGITVRRQEREDAALVEQGLPPKKRKGPQVHRTKSELEGVGLNKWGKKLPSAAGKAKQIKSTNRIMKDRMEKDPAYKKKIAEQKAARYLKHSLDPDWVKEKNRKQNERNALKRKNDSSTENNSSSEDSE